MKLSFYYTMLAFVVTMFTASLGWAGHEIINGKGNSHTPMILGILGYDVMAAVALVEKIKKEQNK